MIFLLRAEEEKRYIFVKMRADAANGNDGDSRVYKVKHFLSPTVVTVMIYAIDIKI